MFFLEGVLSSLVHCFWFVVSFCFMLVSLFFSCCFSLVRVFFEEFVFPLYVGVVLCASYWGVCVCVRFFCFVLFVSVFFCFILFVVPFGVGKRLTYYVLVLLL